MGIEPTSKAWEAFILPLNYTRKHRSSYNSHEAYCNRPAEWLPKDLRPPVPSERSLPAGKMVFLKTAVSARIQRRFYEGPIRRNAQAV